MPGSRLLVFGGGWEQIGAEFSKHRIEFRGAVPHHQFLKSLVEEVDVWVHPSKTEAHPGTICEAVAGRPVLALFGHPYARNSFGVLMVFALVAWPDAITNMYTTVLRAHSRGGAAAFLNVMMAVVALASALALLPAVGLLGAAWAWLIGETAGTVFVIVDLMATLRRRVVRIPIDVSALDLVQTTTLAKGSS